MPINPKEAQHECNVIRRQVLNCYPRLNIRYILHGENEREKAFAKESRRLTDHPAGKYILEYPDKESLQKILKKNRSRFVSIARQNNPGFLGFFKQKTYLALCFINYDRFDTIHTLRNQTYHIAWHAIALHNDYEKALNTKKKGALKFVDEHNIICPDLSPQEYYHRNLLGDIFSASLQTLMGRKETFDLLAKQRITATLQPETGFYAEDYPFPMCIDTLTHIFENNIAQYQKNKHSPLSAVEFTENIGTTYEPTSIEQWRSFSIPAQHMAWTGHPPETILGVALYTGENTYAQSIADMITERLSITPEIITGLQNYNPFTKPEANARMHRKLCLDLLYNLLSKIVIPEDYKVVTDVIEKQNFALLQGNVMGWCVPALIPIRDLIHQCPNKEMMPDLITQSMALFEKEIDEISWETLAYFSEIIFKKRRNNVKITAKSLLDITADNEELSSIYYGLSTKH